MVDFNLNKSEESQLFWSVDSQICKDIYADMDKAKLLTVEGDYINALYFFDSIADQIIVRLEKMKKNKEVEDLLNDFNTFNFLINEMNRLNEIKNKSMRASKYNEKYYEIKTELGKLRRKMVRLLDFVGLGLKEKPIYDPHKALQYG